MKYIAIDIGSSFAKSAVLDLEKKKVSSFKKVAQPKRSGGGRRFEVDADGIFNGVRSVIDSYLDEYGDIAGILLSTQMHGFILANEDGSPICPYVSWQDERCLEHYDDRQTYLEHLESMISREEMKNNGVYLKPPLAACNLYTMLAQGLELPEGARFCTLGSYIILRLTGNNECHITNAAPCGLVDVAARRWNTELIRRFGFEGLSFPVLHSDLSPCGSYTYKGRSIPVYPDVGDQQTGALGSLAKPRSDLIANIATAAQLGYITDKFVPGPYEIRPFFENTYLYTISRLPGGRNMEVLINFFADIAAAVTGVPVETKEVFGAVDRTVDSLESCGITVNSSFFKTEEYDCGSIGGIYFDNLTMKHVISAFYEDVSNEFLKAANKLPAPLASIERMVFSGGVAARTPLLRRQVLDRLGINGTRPPVEDEVFIGHYRMALFVSGASDALLDNTGMVENADGGVNVEVEQ